MVSVGWHFVFNLDIELITLMQTKESSVNESCLASVEGTNKRTLELKVATHDHCEACGMLKPLSDGNSW